jgi:ubiquinol-cytochrome c reductase cytochrome c1 subunit
MTGPGMMGPGMMGPGMMGRKGQSSGARMVRTRIAAALVAAALAPGLVPGVAVAAEDEAHVTDFDWSFEGPFGTFDQMQLQRGLQIYNTICSGCHGLQYLAFRALGDTTGPGLPDEQVKALAAQYQCADADLPAGETRACLPSDRFPPNTSVGAPDLTLMAKARAGFHGPYGLGVNQFFYGIGGPEYIASLLLGYTGEEQEVAGNLLYENHVFPGGLIQMAPPLYGDDVEYTVYTETGAPAEEANGYVPPEPTMEQEAMDVAAFLMWAAEPSMVERKHAGLRNLIMIVVLAVLLYYTNKKLWQPIKHRQQEKERAGT